MLLFSPWLKLTWMCTLTLWSQQRKSSSSLDGLLLIFYWWPDNMYLLCAFSEEVTRPERNTGCKQCACISETNLNYLVILSLWPWEHISQPLDNRKHGHFLSFKRTWQGTGTERWLHLVPRTVVSVKNWVWTAVVFKFQFPESFISRECIKGPLLILSQRVTCCGVFIEWKNPLLYNRMCIIDFWCSVGRFLTLCFDTFLGSSVTDFLFFQGFVLTTPRQKV